MPTQGETVPTIQAGLMRGARIARRVGRRGSCLLFLAVLDLIYAFGLMTPTERSATNPTFVFLGELMPIWAWAAIWATVGLTCLIYAFHTADAPAFAAAIALKGFWGLVFGFGWVLGEVERGYLSTAIWGAFALFVLVISGWRENNER